MELGCFVFDLNHIIMMMLSNNSSMPINEKYDSMRCMPFAFVERMCDVYVLPQSCSLHRRYFLDVLVVVLSHSFKKWD